MSRIDVELSPQVVDFVWRQAPEPRRRLRKGLRDLAQEKGDIRALEGRLEGWLRLRVGAFRIVLRYETNDGRRILRCAFAERRNMVYELFEKIARQVD